MFVALAEEGRGSARIESGYWPVLRLTDTHGSSGRQYTLRDDLPPRAGDKFPFEKDMADTMLKFTQGYRHLLE